MDKQRKTEPQTTDTFVIVEHTFTPVSCPGCGDPHYIDGCRICGHGIDGIDRSGAIYE